MNLINFYCFCRFSAPHEKRFDEKHTQTEKKFPLFFVHENFFIHWAGNFFFSYFSVSLSANVILKMFWEVGEMNFFFPDVAGRGFNGYLFFFEKIKKKNFALLSLCWKYEILLRIVDENVGEWEGRRKKKVEQTSPQWHNIWQILLGAIKSNFLILWDFLHVYTFDVTYFIGKCQRLTIWSRRGFWGFPIHSFCFSPRLQAQKKKARCSYECQWSTEILNWMS